MCNKIIFLLGMAWVCSRLGLLAVLAVGFARGARWLGGLWCSRLGLLAVLAGLVARGARGWGFARGARCLDGSRCSLGWWLAVLAVWMVRGCSQARGEWLLADARSRAALRGSLRTLWSRLDSFAGRKFQQRSALKMKRPKKKSQASLDFFFGLFIYS